MTSILVTGANRGIGLGLVRHLVKEPSVSIVIATARDVDSASELKAIKSPKLHLVALEVSSEESIAKAEAEVAKILGDSGLDFLVNNAGIFPSIPIAGDISPKEVLNVFEVNCIAPFLIVNKFHNLLKKAAVKKGSAQVANISSTLGSLEKGIERYDRPSTVYAMSKAALNMLTRKISVELAEDKIRATAFCPGWVRTDLGTQFAPLDLDESTGPLSKLILSLTEANNGLYYHYDGVLLPW